jgi:phosphohistidine phosphatase
MKLILARHGEADPLSLSGFDRDRPLGQKGIQDIKKMGAFLFSSSLKIKKIFHSPYLRTTQTAEIYYEQLKNKSIVLESTEDLAPEGECSNLFLKLKNFTNSDAFLLVSHNPGICCFAAKLINGTELTENFPFSPGTALAINIPKERFTRGQVIWMISPNDINLP